MDESDTALARYVGELAQSPTVPARSIARTRKRNVVPTGTVRRETLEVADVSLSGAQLLSPIRTWSW